jgi:hypothetical protein
MTVNTRTMPSAIQFFFDNLVVLIFIILYVCYFNSFSTLAVSYSYIFENGSYL